MRDNGGYELQDGEQCPEKVERDAFAKRAN
jgi:hypothetical protein